MTAADDLESARAALEMINPARTTPRHRPALVGEITPTELHYVRSNFAFPNTTAPWRSAVPWATPRR